MTLGVNHKSMQRCRDDDKALVGSPCLGFSIITEGQTVLMRQIAGVLVAMSAHPGASRRSNGEDDVVLGVVPD